MRNTRYVSSVVRWIGLPIHTPTPPEKASENAIEMANHAMMRSYRSLRDIRSSMGYISYCYGNTTGYLFLKEHQL